MKFYEKRFNYEKECRLIDAPKEDVGDWLNWQAKKLIMEETNEYWGVSRTRLEKQEDGSHVYVVVLEQD